MRDLEDARPLLGDPEALQASLRANGYLYLRSLVDADAVLEVRRQIVHELDERGWLAEGSDPMEARRGPNATGEGPAPSEEFFAAYTRVQSLQAFHELAHHPALLTVVEDVLGEPVLCHPRKIFRVSPADDPRFVTPPHQDYRLIQGTPDVLTGWIPLGDCPPELGGLKVLEGSHRELLGAQFTNATGAVTCEVADDDPRWRSASFTAGDLLLFHSLTVHGSCPNRTDRLRMSVDFRYQPLSQPVVLGSLAPHYAPEVPDHDVLTRGWTSTASVAVPDDLVVVDVENPFADDLVPGPSRFGGAAATPAST